MRVSIVGAGIAGLTLAAALGRDGITCQVFEQAPELTAVGAGIQVAPNASRLLHRLGLAGRLDRAAVSVTAVELRRWVDGQAIARTVLGPRCVELFGAPYYALHRADLHSALLSALPPDTVRLDARCVGVTESDGQAWLSFADGSHVASDVVVGADGIHSVVRDALVADEPRPSGQSIYRGLVSAERLGNVYDRLFGERKVLVWPGPEQHFVCYPVAAGRLVSFAATAPTATSAKNGATTESWTADGRVADAIAAYDGWHDDVRAVIAAADRVRRWDLHDRAPLTNWTSGRITIMGDAAHAMLPFLAQGANQAVEDAFTLARCLITADHDIPGALLRYQAVRIPRTAEIQRLSRANTKTLHLPDGANQRDRDIAAVRTEDVHSKGWLYGYDAELAAA